MITIGLFDWVDADGVRGPGQLYQERLDLLADADAAGSAAVARTTGMMAASGCNHFAGEVAPVLRELSPG